MKKDTKASLIIFAGVFILAFVMTLFVPDDVMAYTTHGGLLSAFGTSVAKLVGIRTIIAWAIAVAVTLLVRIVDPEQKAEAKAARKVAEVATKTTTVKAATSKTATTKATAKKTTAKKTTTRKTPAKKGV